MKKLKSSILAVVITAFVLTTGSATVNAEDGTTSASVDSANIVKIDGVLVDLNDPVWDEYNWQIANGGAPIEYWAKVAKCETRSDWQDHGFYGGGLGIFTAKRFNEKGMGTWERWGGEQFAIHPRFASPLQQIVVANRIAVFGWKATYRAWGRISERVIQKDYYKKPAGFNGWGCIKEYRVKKFGKKGWLNPSKWENRRKQYWNNNPVPYKTHVVVLKRKQMGIPKWAYNKYPPSRLK